MRRLLGLPMARILLVSGILVSGALVSSLAAGCAPSGEDPRSRTSTYAPPTGEYRLHYLEPPWELVDAVGTRAFLRIRSNLMVVGGLDGGPGKFELVADLVPGDPTSLVAAEAAALVASGAAIVDGPPEISNAEGVSGTQISAFAGGLLERSHRVVFFPVDGARSLRLAFVATPSLATPEVDAMIGLVQIGPLSP